MADANCDGFALQSARSNSVSNVRAELARLLPGLSPFTALAEPAPQGLAAQHSVVAGGRQGSGQGPLQGLSPAQQHSLAALHQQAVARERQAAAAAGSGREHQQDQRRGHVGGTLGALLPSESPADALAALQHAQNRVRYAGRCICSE
jgi:hypothetical protein